jgi:2-polyprenyl-6-hydroxyphenyl methylase/3-demethylubiquinone-9 3-methyltransferase
MIRGTMRGRYSETRGMDRFYDAIDWLGGYPYESASAKEVENLVGAGFNLISSSNTIPGVGVLGTGCAEYVFRRR